MRCGGGTAVRLTWRCSTWRTGRWQSRCATNCRWHAGQQQVATPRCKLLARRMQACVAAMVESLPGLAAAAKCRLPNTQARLWSGATIVVHIHGAALGNYAFLPRGAVTIHVSLAHPLGGAAGMGDAFPLEFVSTS